MSLSTTALFEEIVTLEAVQRMQVSVKSAVKYGTLIGTATIVSGILGGPVGLAVGGVVSSCVAGYASRNTLQSVPYILLHKTSPQQRKELTEKICDLFKSRHININTIYDFILAIKNNGQLEEAIIQILIMFLTSEMGLNVKV
ncbi:protein Nazo [Calliopsis andreniformis]|uniref:protein Nazo n=1 Tax=Calliopsis andreniformis TaxID=337506 RepID=UPI003FCD65C6